MDPVTPNFDPATFVNAMQSAGGPVAILAAVLSFGVAIYAWPPVQRVLVAVLGMLRVPQPERFAWEHLTRFAKLGLVFTFSALAALVTNLWIVHLGFSAAAMAAALSALAAVGVNQTSQAGKDVVGAVAQAVRDRGTAKSADFIQSPSRPVSIISKFDPAKLRGPQE